MPTLDWIGKKAVADHHRQVPYHLLHCDASLSAGDPKSGNLLVQGDNLLALKALLPYYAGQVKCIYIDPPYNTGNEGWVYNDNVNSPEMKAWLGKAVGAEAEDLSRHDKWLCMMYPRLALLREFLTEDGVIFISIDDNEISHLLSIGDEIFGGLNRRVAVFSWIRKKKGSNLSKEFRKVTEFIVAFKKTAGSLELFGVAAYAEKMVPLLNRPNPISTLHFLPGSVKTGRGLVDGIVSARIFGEGELAVNLKNDIEIKHSTIVTPFAIQGRFRWAQDTVDDEIKNGSVFVASETFRINVSRYNQAEKFKAPSSLLSPEDGIGTNEDASDELRALFPELEKLPFDFPKPTSLVTHLVRSVCRNDKDALILDSFAGSGTTGHAVLALNTSDGGNRRFIAIEMDEKIAQNVTAERLRRVIEGIETPADTRERERERERETNRVPGLGGGFRFCKLGEPLFDAQGNIQGGVKFPDLAAHIFFTETGTPIPTKATGKSPLLGAHREAAIYLLFNGVLGDKRPEGGNVLTAKVLESLPPHPAKSGPRIIYGEGSRLGAARLQRENILFKQVPYEVKVS